MKRSALYRSHPLLLLSLSLLLLLLLFANMALQVVTSDWVQFNKLYCASTLAQLSMQFCLWFYCTIEMKTKWRRRKKKMMIKLRPWDMVIRIILVSFVRKMNALYKCVKIQISWKNINVTRSGGYGHICWSETANFSSGDNVWLDNPLSSSTFDPCELRSHWKAMPTL